MLYEFDFSPLCRPGGWLFTNSTEAVPKRYSFNINGLAADTCIPYCDPLVNAACLAVVNTTYNRYPYSPAIQFVNASQTPEDCVANGPRCFDRVQGQPVCCTAPCESLGIGTPIWSLLDSTDPSSGGVGLSFFGVVPEKADPYGPNCGINNATGSRERDVLIELHCDRSVDPVATGLVVDYAYEASTCHYVISARTAAACGCAPNCNNFGLRQCGGDGCGGYCSGPELGGACPSGQACNAITGLCCRPDCTGRDCGSDGCGGTCGACGADQTCSVVQTCASSAGNSYITNVPIVFASDSSGLAGAFFGGIATVAAAAAAVAFLGGAAGQAMLVRMGLGAFARAGAAAAGGGGSAERVSLMGGGGAGGGGAAGVYASAK